MLIIFIPFQLYSTFSTLQVYIVSFLESQFMLLDILIFYGWKAWQSPYFDDEDDEDEDEDEDEDDTTMMIIGYLYSAKFYSIFKYYI